MKNYKKTNNPTIKNDYQMNQEVAEKIISIIESGNVQEWKKTWINVSSDCTKKDLYDLVMDDMLAINIFTLKQYNSLFVPAGFYLTFKQIKDHNLKLKKGSKGTPNYKACYFFKNLTKKEEEALFKLMEENEEIRESINKLIEGALSSVVVNMVIDEKPFYEEISYNKKTNKFFYKKFAWVLEYLYKAEDCNINMIEFWKIEEEKTTPENDLKKIARVEKVKESYIERSKINYNEIAQNQAYYMAKSHKVVLPLKNQFESIQDYYQTMMHEFAHSTGHSSLLNRATLMSYSGFGSTTYSKEELVAELSSLYTLTALKIANDDIFKNSIAYLKSWGSGLAKGIKHNILNTISHARKATNLILNINEKDQ